MDRNTKHEIVAGLKRDLEKINTIFLCDFKGLTVEKDTALRRNMRESGASYSVVKNTLLKLAFIDSNFAQIDDHLVGNTALVYNEDDVIGLAKLIRDFAKEHDSFKFKAGVVEGRAIDVADLDNLASLPPKEVLISKLMYVINYPIQGLATTLSGVIRKLAVALDQIKLQKEQG
jgi:large subunit ribosomal protein L10